MVPRSPRFVAIALVLIFLTACRDGGGSTSKQDNPPRAAVGGPSVLVAYHSLTNNTEKLARAAAEGAGCVWGVAVVTRRVADVTKADLDAAEGLVLGAPTYYANIPGEMKTVIDNWSWKMRADFTDKVGGAFATGGNTTGGREHTILSLLLYMMHNRMIVVGPTYETATMQYGQMGASAVTGAQDPGISESELQDARILGERVARVTLRLYGDKATAEK